MKRIIPFERRAQLADRGREDQVIEQLGPAGTSNVPFICGPELRRAEKSRFDERADWKWFAAISPEIVQSRRRRWPLQSWRCLHLPAVYYRLRRSRRSLCLQIQWEYRLATGLHLAGPAPLRAHHGPDLRTPCLDGGKSRPCALCRSRLPHSPPVYRQAARVTTDDRRRQRQQSPPWRRVFSLLLPLPRRSSLQLQELELSSPVIALSLGSRESSVERAQGKRFVSFDWLVVAQSLSLQACHCTHATRPPPNRHAANPRGVWVPRRRAAVRNRFLLRRNRKRKSFMNHTSKTTIVIAWICRIAAAVILLQTLFFKFTGAPESVYIFSKVGLEPWGRIGSGVAELIAATLILFPPTTWLGASLALAVMVGAIFSHLTILGIVVMDDGGLLFGLALAVAVCSVVLLFLQRRRLPLIGAYL